MDYILDAYVFNHLPFELSEETKLTITSKAVELVRVADWFCKAQDPRTLSANNQSVLVAEFIFTLLSILTLCHAFRHGGRYLYTWITSSVLAICLENVRFIDEQLDLVWYTQGSLTLMGMRFPVLIILGLYHTLLYIPYVLAKRLRVSVLVEGCAGGLMLVMLSFPVHLIGTKLLWWQWREGDPTMNDRIYSVPWSMLYFDICAGACFIWANHIVRCLLLPIQYDWMMFIREFICSLLIAVTTVAMAVVPINLLHFIHDTTKMSTGVVTVLVLCTFAIIVCIADRHNSKQEARPRGETRYWFDELACGVFVYLVFVMVLAVVSRPENIIAQGMHQPIGPCNVTETIVRPYGTAMKRQKYICEEGHTATYFDFHLLPGGKAPKQVDENPLEWYVMCGTPFENQAQFIAVIWGCSLLAMVIFYQVAARSGTTPDDPFKVYVRRSGIPKQRSVQRSPIRSMERQDSEELTTLLDDGSSQEGDSIEVEGAAEVKPKRSSSTGKARRSSSRGRSPARTNSHIPTPTSTHDLRSRKKKN